MVIYKLKLNMVLVFLFLKFFYGYVVSYLQIGHPTTNITILKKGSQCFAPTAPTFSSSPLQIHPV